MTVIPPFIGWDAESVWSVNVGVLAGAGAPHTTWSFLPIRSIHSRTKSSCSSVCVAM